MKRKKKRKKTDGGRRKKGRQEEQKGGKREGGREKERETEKKAGQMFPKPSDNCACFGLKEQKLAAWSCLSEIPRKLLCLQHLFASADLTRKENMSVLQGCLSITLGLILGKFHG